MISSVLSLVIPPPGISFLSKGYVPESIFFTNITTKRGLRVLKDLYHPNSKYLEYKIGEPRKPVVEDIEEDDAKYIGNVVN